jgi:parallel beta-helix repeat protein
VPNTTGYTLGDELTILAYKTGGESVIIVGLGSDWIDIEAPLTRTYSLENGAAVVNYFPLVRAIGTGITIEGLTLDGNRDTNVLQWQIIGGGLIHMEATNSVIRDVIVINSPSTGILMAGGRDNLVAYCIVSDSYGHGMILDQEIDITVEHTISSFNGGRGNGDGILVNGGAGHLIQNNLTRFNERYGLHPAGDLTRGGVWADNEASHNGRNGFHFCYNNFDILVTGNTLNNNGRSGMGGFGVGGPYADRFNIVTDNVATGNHRFGIETNGGRDNTITFNDVRDNRLGGVLMIGNHLFEGNIE